MSQRDRITTAGLLALAAACAQGPDVSIEPVTAAPSAGTLAAIQESAPDPVETEPRAIAASFVAPAETTALEASTAVQGDEAGAAEAQAEAAPNAPSGNEQAREATSEAVSPLVSYFNTDEYRNAVALNFIPRGETEPDFDPAEVEDMRKVFELRQKGKGDRAVQLLERMHAENPTPHAAVQLAFEYQLDERLRDAASLYAFAVGEYPQFLRAWQQLAAIHFQLANGA